MIEYKTSEREIRPLCTRPGPKRESVAKEFEDSKPTVVIVLYHDGLSEKGSSQIL